MSVITETAVPGETDYAPDHISLSIVSGSEWEQDRPTLTVKGEFVQDSTIESRFLVFLKAVESIAGGEICPAVEEMIWAVFSCGDRKGILYFCPANDLFGDEREFGHFLDEHGLVPITDTIGMGDETLVPLHDRSQLQGVLKLWNGESDYWPFIHFRILVMEPARLEQIVKEVPEFMAARVNVRDETLQRWAASSQYVIEDRTEGPRNEFLIHSSNGQHLEQLRDRIAEIWRSHGVRVED
jgi:hypothetical protein